jgi:hypothetical protein|nr:hypothetical protein [Kofleriaceae bacterium]
MIALAVTVAHADTAGSLRDANSAALAGDWAGVARLVDPLFAQALAKPDLAEAHRLAGLAAFAQQRPTDAEAHFVAYMRLDLDGTLDPALYPPDVIAFFVNVRKNHEAELRALRPQPHRYLILNMLPPAGQFQNGDRTKGIVVGALLGAAIAVNLTTYFVLDSWCTQTTLSGRTGATCDTPTSNHYRAATDLRAANIAAGVTALLTYAYGVYDGVSRYREHTRELQLEPYATATSAGSFIGIAGSF